MDTNGGKVDTNWIDGLQNLFQKNVEGLFETIFTSISQMIHSKVSYTIIAIIVMFWLMNVLKNGYPTREEIFKAFKWTAFTCFTFGIFYSYGAYTEFLSWLMLPAQWIKGAVSDLFGGNANSFGEVITDAINKMNFFKDQLWNYGFKMNKNESNFTPNALLGLETAIEMVCFWIFYILFFAVLVGIAAIILVSTFIAMVILSLAPILIPFLSIPFLKPYFFSWLKLFISYSSYAPASYIILALCMQPITQLNEMSYSTTILQQIYNNQISNFLLPSLTSIIAIYMLKSIPNWISQILGVQGLSGGGSSTLAQTATATGIGVGSFGTGFIAQKMIGGGLKDSLISGAINATPGAKTIQQLMKSFQNSSKIDNSLGAIATPSY